MENGIVARYERPEYRTRLALTYLIHSDFRLAIFSVVLLRTRASSDSVRFEMVS